MNMRACCLLLVINFVYSTPELAAQEPFAIASGQFEPNQSSLSQAEVPEWIQDAKLGFWAHWGPQAQPARGDWYARGMYMPGKEGRFYYEHHVKTYGHPSDFGFKDVIAQWKADKFTSEYADYLIKLTKAAGGRFFTSIAHHHDNFDLWNSKHHRWNAVEMGPRKNIFAMWDKATRDNGLRFGLTSHLIRSPIWWSANKNSDKEGPKAGVPYDGTESSTSDLYHPADWESPEYDWHGRWYKRLKDVIDQHRPDFIYVDGGIPLRDSYGYKLVAHYYNQNMADHAGKLESFILSKDIDDRNVGMYDIEFSVMLRMMPFPWVSDTFIGHWFWNSDFENGDIPYVTSNFQIDHLVDVISKNGVVMMVLPQRGNGTVHKRIIQTLKEMSAWMAVNGEGVHGTRPWRVFGEGPSILKPGVEEKLRVGEFSRQKGSFRGSFYDLVNFTQDHLRYTQSKDEKIIYAFVLGWPGAGKTVRFNALNDLDNPSFQKVELLGHGNVEWKQDENWLAVILPDAAPFDQCLCFKVTIR